jgi:hypothetical protein
MPTRKEETKATMKSIRLLFFRAFLLIALITSYLYLLYGGEPRNSLLIPRHAAGNDLVFQIDPAADHSPSETLGREILLIHKFLREHQSEVTAGTYEITVLRAIDQARGRSRKAAKDPETISGGLSYIEHHSQLGR